MNSETVCEFTNVAKSFRGREIISNLSFEIQRGEMVALTGKSGTGKSTVLNMIGLLEPIDSGSVSLFGAAAPKVKSKRAEILLRHRLGYLFQNYALIDGETADYNLKVAQTYAGVPRKKQLNHRIDSLRRTGLEGFGGRRVYELSGGEQQRLSLARLMLKPCELVLADEPTGSLDAENRDHILEILHGMRNDGKTIIIVTHDSTVAATCDRVVNLEQGTNKALEVVNGSVSQTGVVSGRIQQLAANLDRTRGNDARSLPDRFRFIPVIQPDHGHLMAGEALGGCTFDSFL